MKYQNLLFLLFISFSFEFKNQEFFRKLEEGDTEKYTDGSDTSETTPTNKPDSTAPETTEPAPSVPNHDPDSTAPETTEVTTNVPDSTIPPNNGTNGTETETTIPSTETGTTIPSVISNQTYLPNVEKSVLVLVGVGKYTIPPIHTPGRKVAFVVYYKMIIGTYILPIHMTVTVRITYYLRFLRYLEEKDEVAECERYTYDLDPNIKYNCTFPVKEDAEIGKVTSDGDFKFEGMDESIAPVVTMSSLVNSTLRQNGIQTADGEELLKTQYLLNNTIVEENGLKFKLEGEMDTDKFPDNEKVVLMFDERGNGNIKNATCNINKIKGKVYELDCLAEKSINAHLNGVNGITTSQEKILIYMMPGSDEVLNTGSNYMGLYNRGSSSGLSGGAIAGIVIACIIALMCITIGVMICKKANIPSSFQETQYGVNSNNIPVQESSFGVYNSSTLNNVKANPMEMNNNSVTG